MLLGLLKLLVTILVLVFVAAGACDIADNKSTQQNGSESEQDYQDLREWTQNRFLSKQVSNNSALHPGPILRITAFFEPHPTQFSSSRGYSLHILRVLERFVKSNPAKYVNQQNLQKSHSDLPVYSQNKSSSHNIDFYHLIIAVNPPRLVP
jgi:hypothetical protein